MLSVVDDQTFLAQFEACTWPLDQWHHREHIKIAYLYLCQHPLETSIEKMRLGVRAYNEAQKVPESLTSGYHETITQAWMSLVALTFREFGPSESADAFVDKHTQLLSKKALLFFYSREKIMSADAKSQFVQPDLTQFPRSKKDVS